MKSLNLVPHFAAALLLVGTASTAQAGFMYNYSIDNPAGSDNGGKISNITTSYDTDTQFFNWSHTIDNVSDGFWLVVSDGPNPKKRKQEYAILYGDLDANKLVAYEYNGKNKADSYKAPGVLLGAWDSAFSISSVGTEQKTVSFGVDASAINDSRPGNSHWDGLAFGPSIGVWFHPSKGTTVSYNATDAGISSFSYAPGGQGWYDTAWKTSTVPEPATPLLLAAGLLSLMGFKRKKNSV